MNYQVTFPYRIGNQGEIIRRGDGDEFCVQYHLDMSNLFHLGEGNLETAAADLIEVMFAVTKTDRVCPRGRVGHLSPRNFEVSIPVRQPDLWNSTSMKDLLTALLNWLSGDYWNITFTRRIDRPSSNNLRLWKATRDEREASVFLNSGGLDSLIGIAERQSRKGDRRLISVTTGQTELISRAANVVNGMDARSWGRVGHFQMLSCNEGISWSGQSRDQKESSWRTRSLFPLAVGAATARIEGSAELNVFENGVGAIALPMTGDHQGVGATRSMHPKTLHLFGQIASAVFENQFRVVNNGLFLTKRQGVLQFLPTTLVHSVHSTVSCPRWRYLRRPCGRCISCILRYMALRDTPFDGIGFEPKGWSQELVAMKFQVEQLRLNFASTPTSSAGLPLEIYDAARFSSLSGTPRERICEKLDSLYRSHIEEFDSFALVPRSRESRRETIVSSRPIQRSIAA